jgi:hypothetical protein
MDSLIMSKYSGEYIISQYLETGERHKTSFCYSFVLDIPITYMYSDFKYCH